VWRRAGQAPPRRERSNINFQEARPSAMSTLRTSQKQEQFIGGIEAGQTVLDPKVFLRC
jgi:hypothetical protein